MEKFLLYTNIRPEPQTDCFYDLIFLIGSLLLTLFSLTALADETCFSMVLLQASSTQHLNSFTKSINVITPSLQREIPFNIF